MKTTVNPVLIIVLTLITVGATSCSYSGVDRTITPDQIGTYDARLTGFMQYGRSTSIQENTPGGISREAVINEATLISVDDTQACVDLLMRVSVNLDLPLSSYEIEIDGITAHPGPEDVEVLDYQFTGQRDVVSFDHYSQDRSGSFRITEPEDRIFRVVERRAEVCGPHNQDASIELTLVTPSSLGSSSWGQHFRWTVH